MLSEREVYIKWHILSMTVALTVEHAKANVPYLAFLRATTNMLSMRTSVSIAVLAQVFVL